MMEVFMFSRVDVNLFPLVKGTRTKETSMNTIGEEPKVMLGNWFDARVDLKLAAKGCNGY